jgi:xylulokinase
MPKYNPDARGSFTGITPEHTPAHFARSIMESITCMLKSNLDYLNVPVDEIRIMGGGAKSPLWCQMKADLTGKRLITLKNKETACLGSAILAGVGTGVFKSVEDAVSKISVKDCFEPKGTDYSKAYENYKKADSLLNN